jgi:hypothetical protein
VNLILHVEEPPQVIYYSYVPLMVGDGGGANGGAAVSWLLPLIGTVLAVRIGRGRKQVSKRQEASEQEARGKAINPIN